MQDGGVACGAIALLPFGWRLGLWTDFGKGCVAEWYHLLGLVHGLQSAMELVLPIQIMKALSLRISRCFLLEKGVAADSVDHRVQQGIQIFGVQSIEKALQSRNDPKCMAVLEGSREFKAEALSLAQLQRVARSDSSKGQIQMGCRS